MHDHLNVKYVFVCVSVCTKKNNLYIILMSPEKEISANILKEPDFNIISAPFDTSECTEHISHLCGRSVVLRYRCESS